MFKRPTKVFEDRMAAGPAGSNLATLHPAVTASEGGVPLMFGGQIVGANRLQRRDRASRTV